MTPIALQSSLVSDFKVELSEERFKNAKGDSVALNIYPQSLPAKKGQKDSDHFPYIVVKLIEGGSENEEDDDTCKIDIIIGIYDDNDNYQGYKDVVNVIEKIKQRLFRKKVYSNEFSLKYPFKWLVHEDDTYPYYFGGIETQWTMPKIMMDDPLI